jgi:uncharacterized membrane protein YphA (DoxX/SURF4 family)
MSAPAGLVDPPSAPDLAQPASAPARESRWVTGLRYGTAAVWLFHGLFSKVLGGIPRHQQIVARILGQDLARAATLFVGFVEILLGVWILSRRWPRLCAAAQTMILVSMNALELSFARDLLLAPWPMVCANAVFLGMGWYLASQTARRA